MTYIEFHLKGGNSATHTHHTPTPSSVDVLTNTPLHPSWNTPVMGPGVMVMALIKCVMVGHSHQKRRILVQSQSEVPQMPANSPTTWAGPP